MKALADPFAKAMAIAGRDFRGTPLRIAPALKPTAAPIPAKPALAPNAIHLGDDEYGSALTVDLPKLLSGRLVVQAVSGAGKSWTLRRLLETSAALIQQIVIDPEGEFRSLAEELGYPCIATDRLDAGALADLSAHQVAKILGLDSKTITVYIAKGLLAATKRGSKRLPQQGGDIWTIAPAELRRFVIDHLAAIDFRKVEKFQLVGLLTGMEPS